MDRRRFVTVVAGFCQPLAVHAQQPTRIFKIGLLMPRSEPTPADRRNFESLHAGLRDLRWIEGKNLVIETRWAGENPQRQRELAAELKALPVALIIAPTTIPIRAARDGAPDVPIVMINAGDAVGAGFVASLARPGGNLTGTTAAGEQVLAKQLELLSSVAPTLQKVSVLLNRANPAGGFFFDAIAARANPLGLQLHRIDVTEEGELNQAIARAKGGALLVVGDPMFLRNRIRIAELTLRLRLPTVFNDRRFVAAGGLMSYVSPSAWHWRAAATFVDKILRGAKPADIPVEQPTEFELVINLKTAKALGLAIPPSVLARAYEVIE